MLKDKLIRFLAYSLLIGLLSPIYANIAYSAEVEGIEDSEVPPSLEKTIELKKESEFKLMPLVDITTLGTYSDMAGGNSIGGIDVKGSVAPVVRFNKQNYLIPLYYGAYNRERQVVTEEEGGRIYNEIFDNNGTLEYKYIPGEKVTLKLDGFTRQHYVKEKGYHWSKGLYDYEDWGIGGNLDYILKDEKPLQSSIGIGGEFYHRKYPNYKSLISLASQTAPERNEKDYDGYRPILNYKYANNVLNTALMYSPMYKDYDDKKVIDSNGVLASGRRKDWFHLATAALTYLPEGSSVAPGLVLTGIIVDSNQNYYDSNGTASLTDDTFSKNYYSFKSLSIGPKLTYIQRQAYKKLPATYTLGYAYLMRHYDSRKKRAVDGAYTNKNELDQVQTIDLQVVYPVTDILSFVCLASYTKGRSNMKYETYYTYNYETYFAGAGVRVKR
jgi:hypothetical protein